MVRQVIRREFKIALSVVSVGRLLRTMGLSPQRPLYRAYQQNPEAVQRWKDEQFPAIRKQAKAEGATIYFADEAGIRSDYHAGTTWAPVGRTPVVKATGARFSLNMLSAVSAQGALRFMVHEGTVNAAVFIDFCKRLLRDAAGPGLPGRGRPPRPPGPGHHRVRRLHRGPAEAVPAARLLTRAQPRRVGVEERQARPRRQDHRHQPRTTSKPPSSPPCGGCRNSPPSSGDSSPIRACATSPHNIHGVDLLTNSLVSEGWVCEVAAGPLTGGSCAPRSGTRRGGRGRGRSAQAAARRTPCARPR